MAEAHLRMTDPVTVTAAGGRKSVLGVEPTAAGPVEIRAIRVSGKSVNAADKPVRIKIAQWDTAGTRSAKLPVPVNPNNTAAGLRFTGAETYTAEPTTNEILKLDKLFPPSSGEWEPLVDPMTGKPLCIIPLSKFGVVSAIPESGGNDQVVFVELLVAD